MKYLVHFHEGKGPDPFMQKTDQPTECGTEKTEGRKEDEMKDGTMSSEHNIKTKGGVKMKKSITMRMVVFLFASLYLSISTNAFAVIMIKPPQTTYHSTYGPYDAIPPVSIGGRWFCGFDLGSLRQDAEKGFKLIKEGKKTMGTHKLEILVQHILSNENENDASKFFSFPVILVTWEPNPAQGQTVRHTWEHCYSKPELKAYKREAIRWAKYMQNIWLPKHKGGKK